MRTILASTLLVLSATALAGDLYGVAHDGAFDGRTTLVKVNAATGVATPVFSFTVGSGFQLYGLAYHPGTGHFYGVSFDPTISRHIVDIDPVAQTATQFEVAPPIFEGIEYLPQSGTLALTTSTGSTASTTLTRISTTGATLAASEIPIVDSDSIGLDPITGDLMVLDSNNPTGGFTVNRIVDPLGAAPVRQGVFAGPSPEVDLAAFGGFAYSSAGLDLIRYDTVAGTRTVVGAYNLNGLGVYGLAAVPEPASLIALGVGAAALLRRRRRA